MLKSVFSCEERIADVWRSNFEAYVGGTVLKVELIVGSVVSDGGVRFKKHLTVQA